MNDLKREIEEAKKAALGPPIASSLISEQTKTVIGLQAAVGVLVKRVVELEQKLEDMQERLI